MRSNLERYGDFNSLTESEQSELCTKFETDVTDSACYACYNAPSDGWTLASLQARIDESKKAPRRGHSKRSRLSYSECESQLLATGDRRDGSFLPRVPFPLISPSAMSSTYRDSMYSSPSRKDNLIADMRVEINDLKQKGDLELRKYERHISMLQSQHGEALKRLHDFSIENIRSVISGCSDIQLSLQQSLVLEAEVKLQLQYELQQLRSKVDEFDVLAERLECLELTSSSMRADQESACKRSYQ